MSDAPLSVAETWIAAATTDRLKRRPIVAVRVGGIDLILVREGSRLHACERACPHEQADLCSGHVADGRVHCPRHLASFGLEDGRISPGWQCRDLRRYKVRVAGGMVWVDVGKTSQ